jgi:RNA recognition motif-containing protein
MNTASTRLYVGNLPFHATENLLRDAFAKAGEVSDVHIVLDRATGQSRGFGFVTMATPEDAANAIAQMDGANFDGRNLRVNPAEERQGGGGRGPGGGGGGRGPGGGGGGRGPGGGGRGPGGGGGGGGRGGFGGRR